MESGLSDAAEKDPASPQNVLTFLVYLGLSETIQCENV